MTTCAVCGKRFVIMWPEHYVYKKGDTYFCSQDCMIVYKTKLTRETSGFTAKRKEETEDMNHKLTKEIKKRAVEIAMMDGGGDYIGYLKKNGAKNPSAAWWYIKETLKKADPEKYAKLMAALAARAPAVEIAEKLPPEAVAEVPEELKEFDEAARQMQKKPEPVEVKKNGTLPAGTTKKEVFDALKVPGMVVLDAVGLHTEPPKEAFKFTVTEIQTDLGKFRRDSRDGLLYWITKDGWSIGMTHADWMKLAETLPQIIEVLGGAE